MFSPRTSAEKRWSAVNDVINYDDVLEEKVLKQTDPKSWAGEHLEELGEWHPWREGIKALCRPQTLPYAPLPPGCS